MKTIWKFPLEAIDRQYVEMPEWAKILCVKTQKGQPCLWAEVDPSNQPQKVLIETYGTGHPMTEDMGISRRYIGSYMLYDGDFVGHVYERL